MSALASSSRCPVWCVGHSVDQDTDGSLQVAHQRPVVASDTLRADVEWYEDLRDPSDPAHFTDLPMLVINSDLVLYITPETLDQLEQALTAARLTLVNDPAPAALTERREK